MGRFEIEANGKRYEVEAPSIEAAMAALGGGVQTNPNSPQSRDATATDAGSAIANPSGVQPNRFASALANSGPITPRGQVNAAPTNLEGSIATTLAGINTVPVVGPLLQGTSDAIIGAGSALTGGDYGETVRGLQRRREELAKGNPIANLAGSVGANLAAFGVAGAPRAVASGLSPNALTLAGGQTVGSSALGLTGSTAAKAGNSLASTLGLLTTDGIVRGQRPTDALAAAALPSGVAGVIPVAGSLVKGGTEAVANTLTNRAQKSLTDQAIAGAPAAADLKTAASRMFETATGGNPLAISDNAYFRFLGGVQSFANKLRINADNDPQATGLLSTLMRIADETSQGVAVDLKDLHLIRQLAQKVSGAATGRDASMGQAVVRGLDDLIQGLKPSDILGGADPSQATKSLLSGISTWNRASKVGLIEEAVEKAGTYKSGLENGLRLQFQAMLRNPSTRKLFTAAERAEIEKVANGTAGSNLVTLLGKFGFGTNGAGNMLGGTIGSSIGATIGSTLGPVGSLLGAGLTAGLGSGARRLSETMGVNAANRAAQVVATPNIPIARTIQVNPLIAGAIPAAELAARGSVLGGN